MSVRVTNKAGFIAIERRLDRAAEVALGELGSVGQKLIRDNMTDTVDSRGYRGRVQSGQTKQATQAGPTRRTAKGYRKVIRVLPPHDKHAIVIEEGRRPGKGVSRAGQRALRRWALRKLGPVRARSGRFRPGGRERAERSRTFLIARAIKRRGIPGIHPFRKAADELRRGRARRIYLRVLRRMRGAA